jgi:hypothetical protein
MRASYLRLSWTRSIVVLVSNEVRTSGIVRLVLQAHRSCSNHCNYFYTVFYIFGMNLYKVAFFSRTVPRAPSLEITVISGTDLLQFQYCLLLIREMVVCCRIRSMDSEFEYRLPSYSVAEGKVAGLSLRTEGLGPCDKIYLFSGVAPVRCIIFSCLLDFIW